MTQAQIMPDQTVFGDASAVAGGADRISSILIGVAAPAVIVAVAGSVLLGSAPFVVALMLGLLLVVAAGLFVLSAVLPRSVEAIEIDRAARAVTVHSRNALAGSAEQIPFESIRRIETSGRFAEGLGVEAATLVLADGRIVDLPTGVGAANVKQLKTILGPT